MKAIRNLIVCMLLFVSGLTAQYEVGHAIGPSQLSGGVDETYFYLDQCDFYQDDDGYWWLVGTFAIRIYREETGWTEWRGCEGAIFLNELWGYWESWEPY